MDKTPEQIATERYQELPKIIQDAITQSGWTNKIRNIVRKYNLRVDQGAAVEQNVLLIMLGLISPNNFTKEIIKDAEVDVDTANKISSDADTEIFSDIREILIRLSEEESSKQNTSIETPSRDSLLKEIEDPDEEGQSAPAPVADLSIPEISAPKNTSAYTPVAPATNNTNAPAASVAQKLATPTATETKAYKFDPYREIPE